MVMKKLTPIQAIRHKCRECAGNQYSFIRKCERSDCSLFPYRLGRRPTNDDLKESQIAP